MTVSSDGAAWCSRSSHTPTLAAKSLWVHGWKTKGLSSIDPGHTLSSTSPCSSQSRCIKSYQVIRMQYKLSCQKMLNLQICKRCTMRSYSDSSYRMQRHPGGYEVVRGDWSCHEVLQGLQVPKYESKTPQVERSPGPDARLLSHDLIELPMRFQIDWCIFARGLNQFNLQHFWWLSYVVSIHGWFILHFSSEPDRFQKSDVWYKRLGRSWVKIKVIS